MKKYNIVIVDNDEDEIFFMKEEFDATGLFGIMAQFENGDKLMDWLKDNLHSLPDIILSDLNMHGKNGYDIIEEVTANTYFAHIPVVITSTSSTKSIIDKCLAIGAAEYVIKPSSFIEYRPFIKNLYHFIEEKRLVG